MTNITVVAPQAVELGKTPCESRMAFRIRLDFSTGLEQDINFAVFYNQGTIQSIQSLYVNNNGGSAALNFTMGGTGQVITVPPGAQAYIPVLDANPPTLQVTCTNGAQVAFLQALNFFVPPFMWGQSVSTDIPALDAIIIGGRMNVRIAPQGLASDTDRSGTIAAGGTGQVLMNANASRLQWNLENPVAATETLFFSKISIAGPWYSLNPGGFASDSGSSVYQGIIWVMGATTAHAFTADEGQ